MFPRMVAVTLSHRVHLWPGLLSVAGSPMGEASLTIGSDLGFIDRCEDRSRAMSRWSHSIGDGGRRAGSILGILDNTAIALQIDKDVAFDSPKQASAAKVIERACAVATEQVQCIPAERRATCSSRFGLLARRGNAEGSRHT